MRDSILCHFDWIANISEHINICCHCIQDMPIQNICFLSCLSGLEPYLFVGGYLSTQLGGLRLLGARCASLASLAPHQGTLAYASFWNFSIHINSKSLGYLLSSDFEL